ncbi:MAG: glycosyltransferase involved in cell wall biosynthesis [Planctomycetota bacterium]
MQGYLGNGAASYGDGGILSTRIGLDYLQAVTHWPGVGRYARELVRALVRIDEAPDLRLFEFGAEPRTIAEPALGLAGFEHRYRRKSIRLPRRVLSAMERVTGFGADRMLGGVDIFHRIVFDHPPVSNALQTMAVGELPPLNSAADQRFGERLQTLDGLFVASRHAEDELHRRYGIASEKIHFVSLGCDHWRRDLPVFDRTNNVPSLLVLGAIRAERRQTEILQAFELLLSRGIAKRLVLVGGGLPEERDRFRSALNSSPAKASVQWIDSPIEADLPRLVAETSVLVHLSRGEETAVTPLEAFSFGCAVVTNPGGAFFEALGERANYFDTQAETDIDIEMLATCMGDALETADVDGLRRERMSAAAPFTWEASAKRTAKVWESIASSAKR